MTFSAKVLPNTICSLINQHLYKSVLVNLPPYQGFHYNEMIKRCQQFELPCFQTLGIN